MSREPTQEYLKECFDYVDGKLYWKERPRHHFNTERGWKITNTKKSGTEAGDPYKHSRNGEIYHRVGIDQKRFRRSRIIYVMHFGEIQNNLMVDHIDWDTLNDNIENLRLVTNKINQYNRKMSRCNSSGITGVSFHKMGKKWRARGQDENGNELVLYYGPDFFEAVCARRSYEASHPDITDRHGK